MIHARTATLLLSAALAMMGAQAAAPAPGRLKLTYLANEGVLIESGDQGVLVDALFREGVANYARLEGETRRELESAQGLGARVDVVLVTHWHADHYDPQSVGEHLRHNPTATLLSSQEVVGRLAQEYAAYGTIGARTKVVVPAPGTSVTTDTGGVTIHVLRIRHNPSRNFPSEHLGYLIEVGGRRVIHVGDAEPALDNFQLVERMPAGVDVALVPFWYLTSATGREIVRRQMRATLVVAMHVPPEDLAEVRDVLSRDFPSASVLGTPGTVLVFPPTTGRGEASNVTTPLPARHGRH
jgi:L-ascorbate metabolism protein UlaG (beta-lactamase superfamily)